MIPALALFALAVLYRIAAGTGSSGAEWLPNFAPLAALALCGPALVPRRFALVLPLGALFVSDLLLSHRLGLPLFSLDLGARYAVLALLALVGLRLADRRNLGAYAVASVAGSLLFYLITNTVAWAGNPAYAPTASGWVQALTTGMPGYPPTWTFFRNTLLGDLLFTFAFLGLRVRMPSARPIPARA